MAHLDLSTHPKAALIQRAYIDTFGRADVDLVTRVSGGMSGAETYKVEVDGRAYLLRVEVATDPLRDPHRWYVCLQRASDAGAAPLVRYADPKDGVSIVDFVAARNLHQDYAGDRAQMLAELAALVRKVHATPPFPPLVDYLDGMDALIAQFRAIPGVAHPVTDDLFARYAKVAARYRQLEFTPVSSHNDLNPRNVIYDGRRIWLVDWEASFLSDAYVDLAAIANFFSQPDTDEAAWLSTYFGAAPTPAQSARLYLARQISCVFYGAMMMLTAAQRGGVVTDWQTMGEASVADIHHRLSTGALDLDAPAGQVAYARAWFAEALAGLTDPRLDEALSLAA